MFILTISGKWGMGDFMTFSLDLILLKCLQRACIIIFSEKNYDDKQSRFPLVLISVPWSFLSWCASKMTAIDVSSCDHFLSVSTTGQQDLRAGPGTRISSWWTHMTRSLWTDGIRGIKLTRFSAYIYFLGLKVTKTDPVSFFGCI